VDHRPRPSTLSSGHRWGRRVRATRSRAGRGDPQDNPTAQAWLQGEQRIRVRAGGDRDVLAEPESIELIDPIVIGIVRATDVGSL
jgi:hypothetical protein